MRLSGEQFEKLSNALTDAFPDKSSLEQLLQFKLNRNLNELAGEGSLKTVVFELIKVAKSQGWVEDLVRAARKLNPGNPLLRAIAEELLTNQQLEIIVISSQSKSNKEIQ